MKKYNGTRLNPFSSKGWQNISIPSKLFKLKVWAQGITDQFPLCWALVNMPIEAIDGNGNAHMLHVENYFRNTTKRM